MNDGLPGGRAASPVLLHGMPAPRIAGRWSRSPTWHGRPLVAAKKSPSRFTTPACPAVGVLYCLASYKSL